MSKKIDQEDLSKAVCGMINYLERYGIDHHKKLEGLVKYDIEISDSERITHSSSDDGFGENTLSYISADKGGYLISVSVQRAGKYAITLRFETNMQYYSEFGRDSFGNISQRREVYFPYDISCIPSIKRDLQELVEHN